MRARYVRGRKARGRKGADTPQRGVPNVHLVRDRRCAKPVLGLSGAGMDDEFAEQLHNLQDQALLTRKEADFRSYLVKTGVAEDIVNRSFLTKPFRRNVSKPSAG